MNFNDGINEAIREKIRDQVTSIFAQKEEAAQKKKVEDVLAKATATIEALTAAVKNSDTGVETLKEEIKELKDELQQKEELLTKQEEELSKSKEEVKKAKEEETASIRMSILERARLVSKNKDAQVKKIKGMTESEFASYIKELEDIKTSILSDFGGRRRLPWEKSDQIKEEIPGLPNPELKSKEGDIKEDVFEIKEESPIIGEIKDAIISELQKSMPETMKNVDMKNVDSVIENVVTSAVKKAKGVKSKNRKARNTESASAEGMLKRIKSLKNEIKNADPEARDDIKEDIKEELKDLTVELKESISNTKDPAFDEVKEALTELKDLVNGENPIVAKKRKAKNTESANADGMLKKAKSLMKKAKNADPEVKEELKEELKDLEAELKDEISDGTKDPVLDEVKDEIEAVKEELTITAKKRKAKEDKEDNQESAAYNFEFASRGDIYSTYAELGKALAKRMKND